jgi:hypothetical protein
LGRAGAQWGLEQADGLLVARCALLAGVDGVRHAFSTRRSADGAPGFDVGGREPTAATDRRRRRLTRAAGLGDGEPIALRQVHGNRVVCLDRTCASPGEEPFEADGAVLLRPAPEGPRVAAVRTADCVAVLIADSRGRAVAALHAGWRGIAADIVSLALAALRSRGVGPRELRVALGPAVGPCCYGVGPEVRAAIEAAIGPAASVAFRRLAGDRSSLDLQAALGLQLARQGVERSAIATAPWCTACREDLFHSHRRDGERAGRMLAVIGWAPPA